MQTRFTLPEVMACLYLRRSASSLIESRFAASRSLRPILTIQRHWLICANSLTAWRRHMNPSEVARIWVPCSIRSGHSAGRRKCSRPPARCGMRSVALNGKRLQSCKMRASQEKPSIRLTSSANSIAIQNPRGMPRELGSIALSIKLLIN